MIDGAIRYLRCPVCRQPLERVARALRCPRGHSFDLARQGYADLSAGRLPHVGDTAQMVADRVEFLAAGHYEFIASALTGFARAGLIVDAGVGSGFYLSRTLDAASSAVGVGLDVSKPALRRAARAHPRAAAVLADVWRPLPLASGVASLILNVFAPRNGAEFRRVLRPDGMLVVVTPGADHLRELVEAHGLIRVPADKAARVADALDPHFVVSSHASVRRTLKLSEAEVRTLIGMTPSARHVAVAGLRADAVCVTAAVEVTAYRVSR
jgi:23S rRNA (guanine745-N1)-methyltransferase